MQSTNCETQTVVSTSEQDVKPKRRNHEKRERDPAKYKLSLLKKQKKVADRLSALDPSETKKVQRMQSKLADINAKIETLSQVKPVFEPAPEPEREEKQVLCVEEPKEKAPKPEKTESVNIEKNAPEKEVKPVFEPAPEPEQEEKQVLCVPPCHLAVVPEFSKAALKEASRKFLSLRKDLKQEKSRIKNLGKVLSAVKVLSRANLGATVPRVFVGDEQVNQTKSDLTLARQQLSEKRQLVKDQAHELRDLVRLHRQLEVKKRKDAKHERKERKEGKKDKKEKREKREKKEKSDC